MADESFRVQILGPVRAWRNGEPVTIRGKTGRSVVAKLALAHRRRGVATVDSLIEALWGDTMPSDPIANIHTAISRLRRAFGESVIETTPGGYRLAASVITDIGELEHLLTDSEPTTKPEEVVERIQSLVSQSTGEPLGDVATTDSFEPDRVLLRELRSRAIDHHASLLLAAGRAEETIAELGHRVEREPLRERTHLLLANALADAGRSVEALRVLSRYRSTIVEESGLEASTRVDDLEQRILTGETGVRTGAIDNGGLTDNLPMPSSRLVGRSVDIEDVSRLLTTSPLVTLSGVGGCGKTRLAIATAATVRDRFPDGIVFVDLSVVAQGPIGDAVVHAGGFQISHGPAGGADVESVARFLARRELLLILDNCEHVIESAAELVQALLSYHPVSTVLATSRVTLDIPGERVYRVAPLDAEGDGSAAMMLLIDRAQAADQRFTLDQEGRRLARELCHQLDGLPLAIELAAAQLVHLDISDVLHRLDQRLRLSGGGRHHPNRQQNLQVVMDWSWDLLDADRQRLLAALSIFTGTFGPTGVETVCGLQSTEDPLDSLRSLVNASLVEVGRRERFVRYRLLETVHLFAHQKLAEMGQVRQLTRRHRDWLLDWVAAAPFGAQSLSGDWIAEFTDELDNVFAAIDRSMADGDWEDAARLLTAGAGTWRRGHRSWRAVELTIELEQKDLAEDIRTRLLIAAADAAMVEARYGFMTRWTDTALESARRTGDRTAHALSAAWAGIRLLLTDHRRGVELFVEAHAAADTPIVRSWTSHMLIYANHMDRFGEPMDIGDVEDGPPDSVARGGIRELATINDAFGGRLQDARRHLAWFDAQGHRLSPVRQAIHSLPVLVEALAGDPQLAIEQAPEAASRIWRTTETVERSELLLAMAIAHHRLGHSTTALRQLENLKTMAMAHPIYHDLLRRYARLARAATSHTKNPSTPPHQTEIERLLISDPDSRR